jgi:hypothetical protein
MEAFWINAIEKVSLGVIALALLYILYTREMRTGKTTDALFQALVDLKETLGTKVDHNREVLCKELDNLTGLFQAHDKAVTDAIQKISVIYDNRTGRQP